MLVVVVAVVGVGGRNCYELKDAVTPVCGNDNHFTIIIIMLLLLGIALYVLVSTLEVSKGVVK